MRRPWTVALVLLLAPAASSAQPIVPRDAAAASADAPAPPPPRWPATPEPTTSASAAPRPDPAPGVRERSSRGRRTNPASGALLILMLVFAMGWYVRKKIRRY